MAKNLQNSYFLPFLLKIKDPLKLEAKNFFFNIFWGNIVVHMHAKYRNDRMKTEGAYWIWKKVDGGQTAHHRIDSADYVRSGAKKTFKAYSSLWTFILVIRTSGIGIHKL